jgi:hypothetical protein
MSRDSSMMVSELLRLPRTFAGEAGFFDLLLEAVSYLRDGGWSGFEQAYEAVDAAVESPVFSARDAARVLSALGHMDVQLDRRAVRPVAWSVSPPTLLRLSDSEWLLCGRRPVRLIATLVTEAERRGANVVVEALSGQPARITLRDAPPERADGVVAAAREEGHELKANPFGPARLARALPRLAEVVDDLQRGTPAVGGSIEKLELDDRGILRWRRVVDFSVRGSYRFDPPPLTYAFVDHAGARPARVDARLARLLALLSAGRPPLAWDPATGSAIASYYAEPPALYERALALSSGHGPQPLPRERVTRYPGVSEEVAVEVYRRLATWDANGGK